MIFNKLRLFIRKHITQRRVVKMTREALLRDAFLRKKLVSMIDDIGKMEVLAPNHPMLSILQKNREQIFAHLRFHGIDPQKYIHEIPKQ